MSQEYHGAVVEVRPGSSREGLERIERWLSAGFLGMGSAGAGGKGALGAMAAGMVVQPFLLLPILWMLLTEKKYGWLVTFVVLCGWPFLFLFLRIDDGLFHFLIVFFALLMISIYCLILKVSTDTKLSDLDEANEMLRAGNESRRDASIS